MYLRPVGSIRSAKASLYTVEKLVWIVNFLLKTANNRLNKPEINIFFCMKTWSKLCIFVLFIFIFLWFFFNSVQLKPGDRKSYWAQKLTVKSIWSIFPTLFPASYWPDDMVISVKGLLLAVHWGDVVLGVPVGFFISICTKILVNMVLCMGKVISVEDWWMLVKTKNVIHKTGFDLILRNRRRYTKLYMKHLMQMSKVHF